jgi:hypothetical protein
MNARWPAGLLVVVLLGLLDGGGSAHAQDLDVPPRYVSPERFVLELRVGPYQPDMNGNPAFNTFFSGDSGPLLGAELDVIAWRFPDIAYLAVGGRIGTLSYSGKTLTEANVTIGEETSLSILPLDLLAVVRFDALARRLSIPFILTGKLGYEWAHWSTGTEGADDEHSGWSVGVVWGAQLALDLDALDRGAARNLDEEWGINHAFFFAELFKFTPSDGSFPIGDSTWTLGLGFVF